MNWSDTIANDEKIFLSIDCILIANGSEKDARLTILNRSILLDLKKGFQLFGKQKWVPLLDLDVREPMKLSLGEGNKTVIIEGHGEVITIISKDMSTDKLLKEIRRNIDIANNLSKSNTFSSKRIIYDLKKERGIK